MLSDFIAVILYITVVSSVSVHCALDVEARIVLILHALHPTGTDQIQLFQEIGVPYTCKEQCRPYRLHGLY